MEAYQLIQQARRVAETLFDDIEEVALVEKEPSGERHYHVTRRGSDRPVRVSLKKGSPVASIEWRKSGRRTGAGERIFRLQGIVVPE